MNIQIIGEGCKNCRQLRKNLEDALSELKLEAEVESVENLLDIVRLSVMTAPSLMINGKLVISGQVASKEQLKQILSKRLAEEN